MTLSLFLRAITTHMFQSMVTGLSRSILKPERSMSYENVYFHLARIYCKDGFNLSVQINHGNYCESEVGYRKFGFDWISVEFGYSNINDSRLALYAEGPDSSQNAGRIETEILEDILNSHGGIDWEETLSIDACMNLMKMQFNDIFKTSK